MSKRMPAMRFGKRSLPSSVFDLYDERIHTSPYSKNPVFEKRKVPSVYGLVHFLNSKMKPSQQGIVQLQGRLKPSSLNENSLEQQPPMDIHDLEKKFLRAGRFPLVHKRRPMSNGKRSEWLEDSEQNGDGENNEVFLFLSFYYLNIIWKYFLKTCYTIIFFIFGRFTKDLEDCQF